MGCRFGQVAGLPRREYCWCVPLAPSRLLMDTPTVAVARFLSQHAHRLTAFPVDGEMSTVHGLFQAAAVSSGAAAVPRDAFVTCVERILAAVGGAVAVHGGRLTAIDPMMVDTYIRVLGGGRPQENRNASGSTYASTIEVPRFTPPSGLLRDRLDHAVAYTPQTPGTRLQALLDYRTARPRLHLAALRQHPAKPFFPVCDAASHLPHHPERCWDTHDHYVAAIRDETDLSLGDCLYLDTCHRRQCRYVHYTWVGARLREWKPRVVELSPSDYTLGQSVSKRAVPAAVAIGGDVYKMDLTQLGKFAGVVMDPDWQDESMELQRLPMAALQPEGVLFLWVPGRLMEVGRSVLGRWGYTVVHEIAWLKLNQLQRTIVTGRTGHWLNHSKEHVLVGVRGQPAWLNGGVDVDTVVAQTREPGRKPDEVYDMVERMVGSGRKLEVFGRRHNVRDGWVTVGREL